MSTANALPRKIWYDNTNNVKGGNNVVPLKNANNRYLTLTLLVIVGYNLFFQLGSEYLQELFKVSNASATPMILTSILGISLLVATTNPKFRQIAFRPSRRQPSKATIFNLILIILAIQLLLSLISLPIEWLVNFLGGSTKQAIQNASGASTTFSMLLYSCLIAPIVEELLIRGYLLHRLLPYGEKTAVVMSALVFGLMHMNIIQLPFAFMVGLEFAYITRNYGLGWSILAHIFNNAIIGELADYLSNSPVLAAIISYSFLIGGIAGLFCLRNLWPQIKQWRHAHASENANMRALCFNWIFIILVVLTILGTIISVI